MEIFTYFSSRWNEHNALNWTEIRVHKTPVQYQVHTHSYIHFRLILSEVSKVNRVTCDLRKHMHENERRKKNWTENTCGGRWPVEPSVAASYGQRTKMDRCYFGVVAGRLIEIEKSNTSTTSYKSGKLKCINYRIGLFCGEFFFLLRSLLLSFTFLFILIHTTYISFRFVLLLSHIAQEQRTTNEDRVHFEYIYTFAVVVAALKFKAIDSHRKRCSLRVHAINASYMHILCIYVKIKICCAGHVCMLVWVEFIARFHPILFIVCWRMKCAVFLFFLKKKFITK